MFDREQRTQRGFRVYGEVRDMYGADISIVESSGVTAGVWIQIHAGESDTAERANSSILFSPDDLADFGLACMQAAQEKRATG